MRAKTALIGTATGTWIRTLGMRNLTLDAKVRPDTMLKVLRRSGTDIDQSIFVGPGKHSIPESEWVSVHIADGYHHDAICTLIGV